MEKLLASTRPTYKNAWAKMRNQPKLDDENGEISRQNLGLVLIVFKFFCCFLVCANFIFASFVFKIYVSGCSGAAPFENVDSNTAVSLKVINFLLT